MAEFEIPESVPSLSPATGTQITLQVGERCFVTTRETLTEGSIFFSSLLSGRWDNIQDDRSYFIDADGDLFEHILRHLRRGILPVFYDNVKGHDHTLYLALLEEAKYFQIPRLEKWLKDKTYLQAVKISSSAVEFESIQDVTEIVRSDVELEYHPTWITQKVYVCPRDIYVHRGNPDACGRACKRALGERTNEYIEEKVLKVLVIRRQTTFDGQVCIGE